MIAPAAAVLTKGGKWIVLTVILAGGGSRRMGRDKAELPLGGETMLSRLVARFGRPPDAAAVSVDRPGRFDTFGALELVDVYPGLGPANGLLSAFTRTDAERVFLTATDIPNGDIALAKRLFELSDGFDACVIRREDGTVEPLFAVYSRSCLVAAREGLETGNLSLRWLLGRVNARYVHESGLPEWELAGLLRNVNTPEEYKKIKDLEEQA